MLKILHFHLQTSFALELEVKREFYFKLRVSVVSTIKKKELPKSLLQRE